MMIPDFLKRYEAALKDYERECVRITAKPMDGSPLQDRLDLKVSKFLGLPFFPKNKIYPKDLHGQNMILIAQLNFEEIPDLVGFPKRGILQLFFSPTDWYNYEAEVIYHTVEELEQEPLSDFSFLTAEDYDESPIYKVHRLAFEKDIDRGGTEDAQFDVEFDNKSFWDFEEQLNKEEQEIAMNYFDAAGHKLGGYAYFTQSDPRDYDEESRFDIQLLQIDMDEQIMFGDSGIGHVFIHPNDLAKKDFSKAYFYWDCC